jgi:serine/threonine protein kinase
MEYCNDPLERKINMQLLNDQLKENLLRLHAFNIIHNDIKVDNIAFSPFFNRFIFIDFNLSRVIDEKIGMKTFTSFRGTPTFCSP